MSGLSGISMLKSVERAAQRVFRRSSSGICSAPGVPPTGLAWASALSHSESWGYCRRVFASPQRRLGAPTAAMRLRISDPTLIPELIEFLETRVSAVAERVSANEVEVSMLGSYGPDGLRMMLELLVRAWEASRIDNDVSVEVID
jgi:hypothetical protein